MAIKRPMRQPNGIGSGQQCEIVPDLCIEKGHKSLSSKHRSSVCIISGKLARGLVMDIVPSRGESKGPNDFLLYSKYTKSSHQWRWEFFVTLLPKISNPCYNMNMESVMLSSILFGILGGFVRALVGIASPRTNSSQKFGYHSDLSIAGIIFMEFQ